MEKKKSKERPTSPTINDSSLTRESWKIFQVMAEFVEGFERLVHIKPAVSIYGSARVQPSNPMYKLAIETGEKLSNAGFSVVTGGGPGIMEAANMGAYNGKSFSVGLNIVLPHEEIQNEYQDISLRFRHFFTRKVIFVKYAAAYVVMPGGYGTLDEMAEILTLIQTQKTRKIPIVLVNKLFWQGLIDWFENSLIKNKMIKKEELELLTLVNTADEVVSTIQAFYKDRDIEPSDAEKEIMSRL